VECTVGCPLEGVDDAGVLVTMARPSGETTEKCLAPEKAISLIAKAGGRLECVTEWVPRGGALKRRKEWVDEKLSEKASKEHTVGSQKSVGDRSYSLALVNEEEEETKGWQRLILDVK
jgi:hypothetical protein